MLVIGLVVATRPVQAAGGSEVGKAVFVKGAASVARLGESVPQLVHFGDAIFQMDTLETKDGEVKVLFNDSTMLSLAPNSKVLISEHVYKPAQGIRRSLFDILKGNVRTVVDQAVSLKTNDVRLQTATAVAGIRGTDVGTKVLASATQFLCFQGRFEAFFKDNPAGKVMVSQGQFTEIRGPTPTPPASIPPVLMKQFSSQLQAPPLKEVLSQPGSEAIGGKGDGKNERPPGVMPPPPPAPPPKGQQGGQQGPRPEFYGPPPPPPPPPPILPGGTMTVPSGANTTSGSTTGGTTTGGSTGVTKVPVKIPVKLPGGAS